ncbi:hypothetical protein DdX_04975 [Ditylenchus destructor]|uniref:Uncharacterized protein n=1 Tax=Ditylenchus destructor TaxID=166010 RepID=A0AAD4R788_9BILA|nr:hypothetical protein DdX_04975 [Ditylenchus destructor]
MSSSTKRSQKSRQAQSEEDKKAQLAKNAQRRREKRDAHKKAKLEDLKHLDQLPSSRVSSMNESSSLGADDSGFVKNFREENEQRSAYFAMNIMTMKLKKLILSTNKMIRGIADFMFA